MKIAPLAVVPLFALPLALPDRTAPEQLAAAPGDAGIVLVDNLGEVTRDRSEIMDDGTTSLWAAQSFTADATYALTSIEVILSGATPGTTAITELYTGATVPETFVTTLSLSSLPSGPDEIVLMLPDTPVTLVPGETYWVVMGVEQPGFYTFAYAEGNAWIGTGTIGAFAYSHDAGGLWGEAGTDNPFQLRVSVEPAVCYADCDGNGVLNIFDYICFGNAYATGCP